MGEIRDVPQSSMAGILGILLDVPEKADVLVCDITKRISIRIKAVKNDGEVIHTYTYSEYDAFREAGRAGARSGRYLADKLNGKFKS